MTRALVYFLAVSLCMVVVVQGLAHLTWHLSGSGSVSLAALEQIVPEADTVGRDVPVHKVAEWPADHEPTFAEAPMLGEQVERGELPPVEDRLPPAPLMIEPVEQHGPYGGTWRRYANSPGDAIGPFNARLFYEFPFRWTADGTEVVPNVFRDWEVEEGARLYTFHLRPGMRWSDGEPFTTNDIAFWYEHVVANEALTPSPRRAMRVGGELAEFEQIDRYTFQLRFAEPNALLIEREMTTTLGQSMLTPKHYLSRFHPAFHGMEAKPEIPIGQLPELMREQMVARGYEDWTQLFSYVDQPRNIERPTLAAWRLRRAPPARPVVYERNPYYWKVDTQGNQLPYIDRIEVEIYEPEIINLRAIQGHVDMQFRHLRLENYPLLMRYRHASDERPYRVLMWEQMSGNELILAPNQNHQDPVLRELIRDKRFRVALSLGIDRELINEAIFFGIGEPRQVAPSSASPFYVEGYAQLHTAFDPERANALLDELGLERGRDGIRRRPDGRRLRLRIDTTAMPNAADVATPLVAQMWSELGIRAEVNRMNRNLFYQRKAASMHDVAVWMGEVEDNPIVDPRWLTPYSSESNHVVDYATWFQSDGEVGEEPRGELGRTLGLYREVEQTADADERVRLMREIVRLNKENLWVIGTVGRTPIPVVVSERMRNVPELAMEAWHYRTPGNTAPESYAIDEGDDPL